MRFALSAIVISTLTATACAPTTSDPCATANAPITFVNLLSASVGGSYDRCLDLMREDLAIARLEARALENRATALRAESQRLEGERAAAARRLAALNERHAQAVAELERSSGERVVQQRELQQLLAEERQLRADLQALNDGGSGASAAEAEMIERRRQRLQSQIQAILG